MGVSHQLLILCGDQILYINCLNHQLSEELFERIKSKIKEEVERIGARRRLIRSV